MDLDISDVDRGSLAMLAGVGFVGTIMFFYFFFLETEFTQGYPLMTLLIVLGCLTPLFYLFQDLNFIFDFSLTRDDADGFRTKLQRASNFLAGMFLMGIVGMILIAYTHFDNGGSMALRMTVITLLTTCSVFLLLYSMFMEE